jgi:hypothetical protein
MRSPFLYSVLCRPIFCHSKHPRLFCVSPNLGETLGGF